MNTGRVSGDIRSALFLDFDNIFTRLSEQDMQIAKSFGTNPANWLNWLEQSLPGHAPNEEKCRRRILVRRCYLNPQVYSTYRPYFIRSAFETVDCPPLTAQGKTSTDVHMVLDILELLDHQTRLDEFIIMSGDADFTPVLLKLRKWDRRTAILAVGYSSPAYRAASDLVIDSDVFIESALAVPSPSVAIASPEIPWKEHPEASLEGNGEVSTDFDKKEYTKFIIEQVKTSNIPIAMAVLAERIRTRFPQISSNWNGSLSFSRFLARLNLDEINISNIAPGYVFDAKRHSLPTSDISLISDTEVKACAQLVQEAVQQSVVPVPLASIAWQLKAAYPDAAANWGGTSNLKRFLARMDLGRLKISNAPPGYVYDPSRHREPIGGEHIEIADEFRKINPELAELAKKVHDLTDTPYLLPEHYSQLMELIASEINLNGYFLTITSKNVRDLCKARNLPISRSNINFVLNGMSYSGHRFKKSYESRTTLSEALYNNTSNLCANAQLVLSESERSLLKKWFLGDLQTN